MKFREIVESAFTFAGGKDQKPGDQVRGKEKAKLSKTHPFYHRLVGASESVQLLKRTLAEYGGVGGTGAVPQTAQGTTQTQDDPKTQQAKLDTQQMAKSLQQVKGTVGAQGGNPINPVKAVQTFTKTDLDPSTDLNNQEQQQVATFAPALSNILKNPQTAGQFKQMATRAGQLDKAQDAKIAQQQKQIGTNTPAGTQQKIAAQSIPGQQPK
jgi:hypothetical protein